MFWVGWFSLPLAESRGPPFLGPMRRPGCCRALCATDFRQLKLVCAPRRRRVHRRWREVDDSIPHWRRLASSCGEAFQNTDLLNVNYEVLTTRHRSCAAHVMGQDKCIVAAVINLNLSNPDETRSKNRLLPASARPGCKPRWHGPHRQRGTMVTGCKQLKVQTTRVAGFSGLYRGGLVLLLRAMA